MASIAFCIREDYLELFGGDSRVMLDLKDQAGRFFDRVSVNPVSFEDVDVAHVFNIQDPEIFLNFVHRIPESCKIVFSVTFWDSRFSKGYSYVYLRSALKEVLANMGMPLIYRKIKDSLSKVDYFIFNSFAEAEGFYYAYCSFNLRRLSHIIPQYVDAGKYYVNKDYENREFDLICVGRIEEGKRQNQLIELVSKTNIKVMFVGKVYENNDYSKSFLKSLEHNQNLKHVGFANSVELLDLYNNAKTHVLLSRRESPGLVNIEAALCGCNTIISSNGPIREYFSDYTYVWDDLEDSKGFTSLLKTIIDRPPKKEYRDYLLRMVSKDNLETYLNIYKKCIEE
jgi:glycosyltransferase involved in cell wall biosynthesis